MSHSSGIPVSSDFLDKFGSSKSSPDIRAIKGIIEDDSVNLSETLPASDSITQDFEQLKTIAEGNQPSYFLFRLDTENKHGYEWLVIPFVPDTAKIKRRMLYGSTLETLKRQLGQQHFASEMHLTDISEFKAATLSQWLNLKSKSLEEQQADVMTESEKKIKEESGLEVSATGSNVHGVSFPLDDDGKNALRDFAQSKVSLVSLGIDISGERIILSDSASDVSVDQLPSNISSNEPRFTFYRFSYEHEGESKNAVFFIYSCPEASRIKTRMIYSTTKGAAIMYGNAFEIEPDKKIEVTDADELNHTFLYEYLHPPKTTKKRFRKPARPGKGRARLIRKQE
eukprot:gb/GECH01013299.1/.p1 GENE.gb/GECH01013299.1/~~gb/GECH01013299.1/.p1  ORF type:complete len:340 (+),score=97.99 gb/GECH01013299.1/:1-1020(+)